MENGGLRELAYQKMKEMILTCEIRPGEFLDLVKLGKQLGISRTPIREAETKLEREGLLQIIPQKGAYVSAISPKVVRDVYMTRKLLEPGIIRLAGSGISKERLKKIRQQDSAYKEEQDLNALVEADDALHKEIVYSTKNQYIIDIFEQLCDQKKRINIMSGAVSEKHENNRREHNAIIDLLLAEKYEEAAVLMEQHLDDALRQAMNQLIYN